MIYVNLTQHAATPEQIAAGVVDLTPEIKVLVSDALTFDEPPTQKEMRDRAAFLAEVCLAHGLDAIEDDDDDLTPFHAMIGGAPFFMPHLEAALKAVFVQPWYAFSKRESAEVQQPDGTVRKMAVFRHVGFVGGRVHS